MDKGTKQVAELGIPGLVVTAVTGDRMIVMIVKLVWQELLGWRFHRYYRIADSV
jgi:hypothetical protein